MEISNAWETVVTEPDRTTRRLRVPGGWVVELRDLCLAENQLVYVPDTTWDWEPAATTS